MGKKISHKSRIYLIAALIPINNMPSNPLIVMLKEDKQNKNLISTKTI